MAEQDKLRALLWAAWRELNAIRARDGVPYGRDGYTTGVCPGYFSALVDALSDALGDDALPWPSEAMKPTIAALAKATGESS